MSSTTGNAKVNAKQRSMDMKNHLNRVNNVKSFGLSNVKPVKNKKTPSKKIRPNCNTNDVLSPPKYPLGSSLHDYKANDYEVGNHQGGAAEFRISDQNFKKSITTIDSPKQETQNEKKRGSTKLNEIPIFSLLQAFKLQQYTRQLIDLGYGHEVYKLALLLPRQRHDLLTQLVLMPGHKAKFLSLFEIIDQIYPKQKKFELATSSAKKSRKGKKPSSEDADKKVTNKSAKKKKSLMKCYDVLDKQSKKEINDNFVSNIKDKKKSKSQKPQRDYVKIQKLINKHVSKSVTRKAIKSIFPPSMYQKYGKEQKTNPKPKRKPNASNKQKAPLPPVREYKTAQKAHRSKTLREIESIINQRKTETSVGKNRKDSAGRQKRQSTSQKPTSNSRGRQMSENRAKRTKGLTSKSPDKEQINQIINKARHMSASKPCKSLKSGSKSRSQSKGKKRRPTDYKPIQIVNKISESECIEQPLPELRYNYTKGSAIPLYPKKTNSQYNTTQLKLKNNENTQSKIINIECNSNELIQTPNSKSTCKDDNGNNGSRSASGTIMDTTATKRRNPSSPNSHDATNSKSSSISDNDRDLKSNLLQDQRNLNIEKKMKYNEQEANKDKYSVNNQKQIFPIANLSSKLSNHAADLQFENRLSEDMFDKANDLSSSDINANNIDNFDDFDEEIAAEIKNEDSFDIKKELENINKEDSKIQNESPFSEIQKEIQELRSKIINNMNNKSEEAK